MNLTLYFNPSYDQCCLRRNPDSGISDFNSKFVGTMGLLDELELRLGCTQPSPQHYEILSDYLRAINTAVSSDDTLLFNKSLSLSPLACAEELLSWRDELIISGWNPSSAIPEGITDCASRILSGLAAVERCLPERFKTAADRLRDLPLLIEKNDLPIELEIVLKVKEDHMNPVCKAILDALRKKNVKISPAGEVKSPSLEVKHFQDSIDAAIWTAANVTSGLAVCKDFRILSAAFDSFGKSRSESITQTSLRPVEHIFVSAMKLLLSGEDIYALRDYLSSPRHPLDWELRRRLLSNIILQNGFGKSHISKKSFNALIDEYVEESKISRETVDKFIPAPGQKLTFKRLKDLCLALSNWVKDMEEKGVSSPYAEQCRALASYCETMLSLCKVMGYESNAEISENDFLTMLRCAYSPGESSDVKAAVGSIPVVASPEGIAYHMESATWIDCSYEGHRLPLQFLCDADVNMLRESNYLPLAWSAENALAFEDDSLRAGLSNIEKLTILYSDSFTGERRQKHPFLITSFQDKPLDYFDSLRYEDIPSDKSYSLDYISPDTNKDEYDLGITNIPLPESENTSGLEGVFQQPFDWFLESVLKLYDENDSNLSTVKGNVAHDVIHRIFCKASAGGGAVSADAFEGVFKDEFDDFFSASILDGGLPLCQKENKIELDRFKYILSMVSIPKLIEILRCSSLVIVGSEEAYKKIVISESGDEKLCVNATIDLVLKNESGNYVIIDFKWTESSTGLDERKNQIRKGEDYQLAVYRKVIESGGPTLKAGSVDAQAFLMLRTAELLTSSNSFKDANGDIAPQVPGARTKQMTFNETLQDVNNKYSDIVKGLSERKVRNAKKNPFKKNSILKGDLK